MIYLLDTHIIYKALMQPDKLSSKSNQILSDTRNECVISAISFWEIALKYSLGKLYLNGVEPSVIPDKCVDMGFSLIDLSYKDAATYHLLTKEYHKDPFDRMLIWQAIQNNYTLISDDKSVHQYAAHGLKVIG